MLGRSHNAYSVLEKEKVMDLIRLAIGFWLLIFSHNFRQSWLHEYRKAGMLFRGLQIIESTISVFIGLVLPISLVYWWLS